MKLRLSRPSVAIACLWLTAMMSSNSGATPFSDGQAAAARGDHAAAAMLWRPSAESGDAEAQVELGKLYDAGIGLPQDAVQAANWYRKAVAQGNARGQNNLGALYAEGRGVPQSDAMAVEWYRKAAAQGLSVAQVNLGAAMVRGTGVQRDAPQAAEWFRKAAIQGNAAAQAQLGGLYEDGRGVPKDLAKAHALYVTAAATAPPRSDLANLPYKLALQLTQAQREQADQLTQLWARPGGLAGLVAEANAPGLPPGAGPVATAAPTPPAAALRVAPGVSASQAAFDRAARSQAQVTLNMDNPHAREAERAMSVRTKCEAQYRNAAGQSPDRSNLVQKCAQEEAGLPVGPGPVVSTSAPTSSPAAPAFAASSDPRAVFGLLVGGKAPPRAPKCKETDLFSDRPVMAAGVPFCLSMLGTSMQMLLGELFGLGTEDYKAMGIVPLDITVNDKLYDTSITNGVTLFIDRESGSIQRMKIETLLVANETVLAMLTRKFGKPARQTTTTWTNRQTGAVVNRTPNYDWSFPDMRVSYESKVAAELDNSPTILGRIDITTPAYTRLVEDRIRKKNEPPPGRKAM